MAYPALPTIWSYLDAPRALDELQADLDPKAGYDVHHIVERSSAKEDGFPTKKIDGANNLVRIPRMKHWQIDAWHQRSNSDYGEMSPREYLRGKDWDERYRVGLDVLTKYGVLKTVTKRSKSTVEQLVKSFAAICVDQEAALDRLDTSRYNRLYKQMRQIEEELKLHGSDQRRALEALFDHQNLQVQLQAARATLAVLPDTARSLVEKIAASKKYPQAGDAGMTLVALDRGIFKPV